MMMLRRASLLRAFSASARVQAVAQVAPEQVYKDLSAGVGALVDLRPDNDGIKIFDKVFVYPAEAILGSPNGLPQVPGTHDREELLKKITPEMLNVDQYHANGAFVLERIRAETGNKNLDHAGAQKYIRDRLALFENPQAFYKVVVAEETAKFAAKLSTLKAQVASGKMTPSVAAFVKEQREMFERYLKLPPSTPSRFIKLSTDQAANDNYDFQDAMLAAVRAVLGQQTDHVAAQNYLKSKLTPAVLKSDKDFVEQFWASFAEQRDAARLKLIASIKGQDTSLDEKGREFLNKEKARVASYLAYKTNPTVADLAANVSTNALKRLAGVFNGNLGNHQHQLATENAKAAIKALPTERPLYLIDLASVQASKVAELLVAQGAGDVRVVAGGLDRWLTRGLPCSLTPATKTAFDAFVLSHAKDQPNIADINE